MTFDLAITHGAVATPAGVRRMHLGITGGRVVALMDPGERPGAGRIVDARDLWVLDDAGR